MSDETDDNHSAPPASLAPDRDGGDGQQQQSEEETLLRRISEQRKLIDGLPGKTHADARGRAPKQKRLGQLEFQYHMLTERKRLSAVLVEHQEKHGALYSEPCLICLEDIFLRASERLVQRFLCCGGFICKSCVHDLTSDRCPLCRESIAETTEAESGAKLVALAERGVAWAQKDVGECMIDGIKGFKKQKKAGLEWLYKAAAQNHPSALYELYRYGSGSSKKKSREKANGLMLQSANLGHSFANSGLAAFYFDGTVGFGEDRDEAYFRASVAFALDGTNQEAAHELWRFHNKQSVPESSPYLACYYLNIVANSVDDDGSACLLYSQALKQWSERLHDGNIAISGSSVIPAIFFWARKSRDSGHNRARKMLKEWESDGQSECDNCKKRAQSGKKFKQCSTCKAQWYCSKECQVEAWKAGHKKDCKRASILKFEDYLNTE